MKNSEKHTTRFNPNEFDYSKTPPHDVATEQSILGALINQAEHKEAVRILQSIKSEHFHIVKHQFIGNAIIALFHKGQVIDLLSVTNELRDNGYLDLSGGPAYITDLSAKTEGSSHIGYWFHQILYPMYVRRKIIEIGQRSAIKCYEGTKEIFDLLPEYIEQLERCRPEVMFKSSHTANNIGNDLISEMGITEDKDESTEPEFTTKRYCVGSKSFDDIVSLCSDKIILLGGHKGSLKSRFTNYLVTTLAETYTDVACYWVSLEDSAKEQARIYLSSKVHKRPQELQFRLFAPVLFPTLNKWVKKWQSFDIKIRDGSVKIRDVGTAFKYFCSERPDKLNILIVDNVLSLDDRNEFKNDLNSMYDYIGGELLNIKRNTHGLVIAVHHYNEDVASKSELATGYRPRLTNLKGTETWKRIAYQTLLLNRPSYYKDLIGQYSGDQKEILNSLLICDVATNRSRKEEDETALIRFFTHPDYRLFAEVDNDFELPEPEIIMLNDLPDSPPF